MGLQAVLSQKYRAKTSRQNRELGCNLSYNALMTNAGRGQPVQIFHVFGEIVGKFTFIHTADPAIETGVFQKLHRILTINSVTFDLQRGRRVGTDAIKI